MTNAYIPPDCSCPPAQVKRVDGDGRPLPQQFGAQKVAMYQALSDRIPFAHWQTAREDDIGAMVLDWFALLSDNLSFYSDQWIREQHLATATRETSLRQLSTMTGYQPRPNLAARAQLAASKDSATTGASGTTGKGVYTCLDMELGLMLREDGKCHL